MVIDSKCAGREALEYLRCPRPEQLLAPRLSSMLADSRTMSMATRSKRAEVSVNERIMW